MMTATDTQIALGILQLVALTLPVFALLSQVIFSLRENDRNLSLGLVLLFGGGFLVVGAIFSAQSLYFDTDSAFLQTSIVVVTLGISGIGLVLYEIFNTTKKNTVRDARSTLNELDKIIHVMDKNEFETVEEFRESDIGLEDADIDRGQVEVTIDDLEEQRKSLKQATTKFDGIILSYLNKKQISIGVAFIITLSLILAILPLPSSSPIVALGFTIVFMLMMEVADRLGLINSN